MPWAPGGAVVMRAPPGRYRPDHAPMPASGGQVPPARNVLPWGQWPPQRDGREMSSGAEIPAWRQVPPEHDVPLGGDMPQRGGVPP